MFGSKIKLRPELYDKVKSAAEIMGAASADEFVEQVLEQEADRILDEHRKDKKEVSAEEVEDIAKKLKGLGYLD